jgi:hypothetical protein
VVAVTLPKPIKRPAAETEKASGAGDHNRARHLQRNVVAQIGRDIVADMPADPQSVLRPGLKQLARVARSISVEALSAELAAERGDWNAVHAAYERLALLFAEYRLLYVQCLAVNAHHTDDV